MRINLVYNKIVSSFCFHIILTIAISQLISGCGNHKSSNYSVFTNKVANLIEPSILRDECKNFLSNNMPGDDISIKQLPESLKSHLLAEPTMIFIGSWENSQEPAVVFVWGSGFGHWGILVGSKNFVPPQKDRNLQVSKWDDGVYFFQEK